MKLMSLWWVGASRSPAPISLPAAGGDCKFEIGGVSEHQDMRPGRTPNWFSGERPEVREILAVPFTASSG